MSKRHRALGALVVIVGCAGLFGCGSSDSDDTASTAASTASTGSTASATTTESKKADIAFLTNAYTDYAVAEETGLKKAVEPTGGSVKTFNANFDPQKMLQQCQDLIVSRRYNAIVIVPSPVSAMTAVSCVKQAETAGVPVVQLDYPVGKDVNQIEPQENGVVGSILTTPKANADGMVELTKRACEGKDPCKVIAEIGEPGDGFTGLVIDEIKAKLPNVDVVQTLASHYDPATIAKAFPDALSRNPDVNAFVSIADGQALAVVPALKAAGKLDQVKLLGNGASRQGKEAVADGILFGTLANYPETSGQKAGEMAIKALNGQPVSPDAIDALTIKEPLVIVKGNVDQLQPEWGPQPKS